MNPLFCLTGLPALEALYSDPSSVTVERTTGVNIVESTSFHATGAVAAEVASILAPVALEAALAGRVVSVADDVVAAVVQQSDDAARDTPTAIGFADDATGSAYEDMRGGGGHAMQHLADDGPVPNTGSLAARRGMFENMTSPMLTRPTATFSWRLGGTSTRAFAREVAGRRVVVFVATDGDYQVKVLSAFVPDAAQVARWGL